MYVYGFIRSRLAFDNMFIIKVVSGNEDLNSELTVYLRVIHCKIPHIDVLLH